MYEIRGSDVPVNYCVYRTAIKHWNNHGHSYICTVVPVPILGRVSLLPPCFDRSADFHRQIPNVCPFANCLHLPLDSELMNIHRFIHYYCSDTHFKTANWLEVCGNDYCWHLNSHSLPFPFPFPLPAITFRILESREMVYRLVSCIQNKKYHVGKLHQKHYKSSFLITVILSLFII